MQFANQQRRHHLGEESPELAKKNTVRTAQGYLNFTYTTRYFWSEYVPYDILPILRNSLCKELGSFL